MKGINLALIMVTKVAALQDQTRRVLVEDDGEFYTAIWFIVLISILGCLILSCGTCIFINKQWAKKTTLELEKATMIAQTEKGQIEYQVFGTAPYVVYMLGSPGLVHTSYGMENSFPGFGLIVFSRPGYCRTPITSGKTGPEQADLVLALLDHLKVDKCVVYGCSGAGPVVLNMAIKDPQRVKVLLMGCAVTGEFNHPVEAKIQEHGAMMKWGMSSPSLMKMMANSTMENPEKQVRDMLKEESTWDEKEIDKQTERISKDPYCLEVIKFAVPMYAPFAYHDCWTGFINDMQEMYKEKIDFEKVKVPTLILHGDADGDVAFSNAEKAHAGIEGSELLV